MPKTKIRIPKWKTGLAAFGIAGLLTGGLGMLYDGAPAASHAAHAHTAMLYDGPGNHSKMLYD